MLQSKLIASQSVHRSSQSIASTTDGTETTTTTTTTGGHHRSSKEPIRTQPIQKSSQRTTTQPTIQYYYSASNNDHRRPSRPLSNLNHSFSSFYQYRSNLVLRPFVDESRNSFAKNKNATPVVVASSTTASVSCSDATTTTTTPAAAISQGVVVPRGSSTQPQVITYITEAPTQSTVSASTDDDEEEIEDDDDAGEPPNVCEQSSFWDEWAEELLQKEEDEYQLVRHSLSPAKPNGVTVPTIPKIDMTIPRDPKEEEDTEEYYEDPSFAFVAETPDTSLVYPEDLPKGLIKHDGFSMRSASTAGITVNKISSQSTVVYPPSLMNISNKPYTEENDSHDDDSGTNVINEEKGESTSLCDHQEELNEKHVKTAVEPTVSSNDQDGQVKSLLPSSATEEDVDTITPKMCGSLSRVVDVDLKSKCPLPDDDDTQTVPATAIVAATMMMDINDTPTKSIVDGNEDSVVANPMFNTSMSTVAAMNISHATIQLPNSTILQQAMEYSNIATELVQEKKYVQAMESFQQAIDCYNSTSGMTNGNVQQSSSSADGGHSASKSRLSILTLVNVAGCYRNMGTVSRLLERYNEGTAYLCKAEEYYTKGREEVEIRSSEAILTLDGKLLDDSNQVLHDSSKNNTTTINANSYYTNTEDESMCLDGMILETLQSRAYFYVKYQDDKEQAIECHEQCLKHLIHINKLHLWDSDEGDDEPVREQGVAFVPLSKAHHTSILVKSLESLGNLYRSIVSGSSSNACMNLFEDALDILQGRLEQDEPTNDTLIQSVSLVLRYLSEIYFEREELDKAVDALHDSTAIKLTASGEPCSEALEVMDKMGAAHEQMENFEKALSCYEQTLFARCKYYGNTHFFVAKSLVNVARVTERKEGSTQESVELYKAANAIFALHMLSDGPSLDKEVENILQLIPTVIRQGRYEKAVSDLNMCLTMADQETNSDLKLDKAQIYFDLGRAYLGMNDYKMATTALTNAMKQVGDVKDEDIYNLLQRVEFLQREEQNRSLLQAKPIEMSSCLSNAANASMSYVPDPTLSFHDITFQLQGERSMYIFEDDGEKRTDDGANSSFVHKQVGKSNNPHYDILYHSFVKDPDPTISPTPATTSGAPSIKRLSLSSLCSRRKRNETDTTTSISQNQSAKVGHRVAALIQRLRIKSQRNKHIQKLKKFSVNCFKVCQGKPTVVESSQQELNRNTVTSLDQQSTDSKEVISYSSFECPPSKLDMAFTAIASHCRPALGERTTNKVSKSSMSIFGHVIIAEEEGGFGAQLVHP